MASLSLKKELEDELIAYGMKLMNPFSSTDELLKILDKVESLLIMVCQCHSDSMKSALQLVKRALIRKELLMHIDEDVKVSVVSCITELFRITAPEHPYDDRQMKEILQHTVLALKKLSDVTSDSYYKAVHILENVAKVRAFVILLDLEYDTLVIEIFKLFLGIIRPYHPQNVFNKMEQVMTQLIEDSDELSVELLRPLLDSVRKKNQIASPVSSILGEKVLEDCAAIVKPYVAEALKSMSLKLDDCAEFVASICHEMPKGEQMMANANAPDAVPIVKLHPSDAKFGETALQDDTHMEQLKDTCTENMMKPDNPEDVPPETNAEVVSGRAELFGSSGQHSPASQNSDISNESHGNRGQLEKKESMTNEDAHLGMLVPEDVPQSEVKEKDSLHIGLTWGETTKRTVYVRRKRGNRSRKNESSSNFDAETKSEFRTNSEEGKISDSDDPSSQRKISDSDDPSSQQRSEMIQKNEAAVMMHDIEESGDKTTNLSVRDENHLNIWVKSKSGIKCATGKDEDSKRPRSKHYGEDLVGSRIKVWWPLDKVFYEGAISSYDPVKKRHKITYTDGEVEILNLRKERWEMFEDNSSEKDHGTDFQSPAALSVTPTKKKSKRSSSTKKEPDTSSSKRPKSTAKKE